MSNNKEQQLQKLCQEIYAQDTSVRVAPLYPWVLVRVLPKEQKVNGVWLLDRKDNNKIVYEGVVLAPWRSYTVERSVVIDGVKRDMSVTMHCPFIAGERIVFPHYEGYPAGFLDETKYRFVRSGTDQNNNPYCGVFGWLSNDGDPLLKEKLNELFERVESSTLSGA